MIVGFSTSCRQASTALIAPGGEVLWCGREEAPQAASGACLRLLGQGLRELGLSLSSASLFVADLGPGSFTGVRVGVTLAKTFAYTLGVPASGTNAFDLIDPVATVVIPNKRGEWFVRVPGSAPVLVTQNPPSTSLGYGTGLENQTYPDAKKFGAVISVLKPAPAERLVPAYLVDPSISVPKKPYGAGVAQ